MRRYFGLIVFWSSIFCYSNIMLFDNTASAAVSDEKSDSVELKDRYLKTFINQRLTNAFDVVIFSISAKVISDYLDKYNACSLPPKGCLFAGTCAWMIGELAEIIYKKSYEHITHKNLRKTLGKSEIYGIEIDHQRLLRRIISLIILFIPLYFIEKGFENYADWVHRDANRIRLDTNGVPEE